VEKAAYRQEAVSEQDKQDAIAGYTQVKKVIKDYKRKKIHVLCNKLLCHGH
jgi:hypothetical protein